MKQTVQLRPNLMLVLEICPTDTEQVDIQFHVHNTEPSLLEGKRRLTELTLTEIPELFKIIGFDVPAQWLKEIERKFVGDKCTEISLAYYDRVVINDEGIFRFPEHGPEYSLCNWKICHWLVTKNIILPS